MIKSLFHYVLMSIVIWDYVSTYSCCGYNKPVVRSFSPDFSTGHVNMGNLVEKSAFLSQKCGSYETNLRFNHRHGGLLKNHHSCFNNEVFFKSTGHRTSQMSGQKSRIFVFSSKTRFVPSFINLCFWPNNEGRKKEARASFLTSLCQKSFGSFPAFQIRCGRRVRANSEFLGRKAMSAVWAGGLGDVRFLATARGKVDTIEDCLLQESGIDDV